MRFAYILFKQNKLLSMIHLFAITTLFLLILTMLLNVNFSEVETRTTSHFKDKNLMQLSDNLFDELEVRFFSRDESYHVLKKFADELSAVKEFTYYHTVDQPLYMLDFKGDQSFDPYYEYGDSHPLVEMHGQDYHAVKSLQINENAFRLNELELHAGRKFYEDEYVFKEGQPIPVILGSAYAGLYHLNDTVDISLYGKALKGNVIGFFESSQKIIVPNAPEPEIMLDRYIVLPIINFNTIPSHLTEEDEEFYMAALLNLANGMIITNLSPLESRLLVENIGEKVEFTDFQLIGANSILIDTLVNMTEMNRSLLITSTVIIFIIIIMLFLLVSIVKVRKNVEIFKVFLISGANMNDIIQLVRYEYLFTALIGFALSTATLFFMVHNPLLFLFKFISITAITITCLILVLNFFITKTFQKIDLVQELKR